MDNTIFYKFENEYVDDAWSEELPSGLISILFNCKERGLEVHNYDNSNYSFSDCKTFVENTNVKLESVHIDKLNAGFYLQYVSKNKDQIEFMFVPIYLKVDKIKWDKICDLRSKNYEEQLNALNLHLNTCEKEEVDIWQKLIEKHKLSNLFYNKNKI